MNTCRTGRDVEEGEKANPIPIPIPIPIPSSYIPLLHSVAKGCLDSVAKGCPDGGISPPPPPGRRTNRDRVLVLFLICVPQLLAQGSIPPPHRPNMRGTFDVGVRTQ